MKMIIYDVVPVKDRHACYSLCKSDCLVFYDLDYILLSINSACSDKIYYDVWLVGGKKLGYYYRTDKIPYDTGGWKYPECTKDLFNVENYFKYLKEFNNNRDTLKFMSSPPIFPPRLLHLGYINDFPVSGHIVRLNMHEFFVYIKGYSESDMYLDLSDVYNNLKAMFPNIPIKFGKQKPGILSPNLSNIDFLDIDVENIKISNIKISNITEYVLCKTIMDDYNEAIESLKLLKKEEEKLVEKIKNDDHIRRMYEDYLHVRYKWKYKSAKLKYLEDFGEFLEYMLKIKKVKILEVNTLRKLREKYERLKEKAGYKERIVNTFKPTLMKVVREWLKLSDNQLPDGLDFDYRLGRFLGYPEVVSEYDHIHYLKISLVEKIKKIRKELKKCMKLKK
jgi:hypothetical protein